MSSDKRYVVSRIDWAESEFSDTYKRRTPRTVRVAEFRSFDAAEFDRRRREEECRRQVNPFEYGGEAIFYQTSLDAPRLHDWLMDAGIEPPANPNSHAAWATWWKAFAHTWSEEQLAHAWTALDKVRFFEITEEHLERKAYVVVEVNWTWQDEPTLYADYEGGSVVRAFRTRKAAETECDRLNSERQLQSEHQGFSYFTKVGRGDGTGIAGGMEDTEFFEVVEIDLADEPESEG